MPFAKHVRSLGLYVLAPTISSVAPLAILPAISGALGASAWATFALAQSVGLAVGVVAELGWGVTGPQEIAGAAGTERTRLFLVSIASKGLAAAALSPIAVAAAVLLATTDAVGAAIVAVASLAVSLQQGWYFYGLNRPGRALLSDVVPKAGFSLLGALLVVLGLPLWGLGIVLLCQPLVSLVIACRMVRPPRLPWGSLLDGARQTVRRQRVVVSGRMLSTAYTSLPIVIVRLVHPAAVADFAALDRVMRMGLGPLSAIPNRLQSWIGSTFGDRRIARCRYAFGINAVVGVIAAIVYLVGFPVVNGPLFAHQVAASPEALVAFALLAAAICASRGSGLWLVGVGRANAITVAITSAVVVGLPSIGLFARFWGLAGAAIGVLLAETVGLAVQLAFALKSSREMARVDRGLGSVPRDDLRARESGS